MMISSELNTKLLVDESQLGERLNRSLQENHRADFSLMLAMLSKDVTDAPRLDNELPKTHNYDLRQKFGLGLERKFYAQEEDLKRAEEMSELFLKGSLQDVFLSQCLNPEPLLSAERIVDTDVEANLSPLEQTKLRLSHEGVSCDMIEKSRHDLSVLDEIKASRLFL